jgi:hypothetical protein
MTNTASGASLLQRVKFAMHHTFDDDARAVLREVASFIEQQRFYHVEEVITALRLEAEL